MNEDDLLYALAKQVPAMRYRITLARDFGPLKLVGRDADGSLPCAKDCFAAGWCRYSGRGQG